MKIEVYNHQEIMEIPKETAKLIEKAVTLCLKRQELPYDVEATITLVDNDSIQQLNKEHREIDMPTDVLSFPLLEYINGEPQIDPSDIDPDTKLVFLGDIIISVEKAQEQALAFDHSIQREYGFLAVHGILHLLGYDHETPEDEELMFSIQEEVLNEMGLTRK